ncbi:uncharacterized protein LOC124917721 [Impatiens glandulifera]|uniref:uncharacterized protein LOC124917721 n=1 Tax=Impatiens glandulifera TaxID=253017 RepID=UPI001FB1996A|nr:uncharacterized protein LOC124917721 [Impatiens glandulifera]
MAPLKLSMGRSAELPCIGMKLGKGRSPCKGIIRFGKKGKLNPRYIGPYEILEAVGEVAYRLALPPSLAAVHNYEEVQLAKDLSYEERPTQILARQTRKLRNKEVNMVKVLWHNSSVEESTWEVEQDMQQNYPELFRK